jgi:hypothetical protein
MRYSLKALLAIPVVVALAYSIILPVIYSERYSVLSNLHIKDWGLNKMEKELNKRIPERVIGEVEYPNGDVGNVYSNKQTIDGVTISAQPFGVAFSTDSTRWNHKKAVEKVDKQMRAFLDRNPDLVSDWAAIEVYTYRGPRGYVKKRQISYNRFDMYPPEQQ